MPKRLYIPLPTKQARKQLIVGIMQKEMEKGNKYLIEEAHLEDILNRTKGYSGSDMISVCREAAMMPIRSIEDINSIEIDNLRGIDIADFKDALSIVNFI
jgi:SpoVK/Ycf46/Vps4 family AAA+-type ATPase